MARFCSHCGARNEDDAAFCEQCGQPLAKTQTQPADPPNSRSVLKPPGQEIVRQKPARHGLLIGAIAGTILIALVVVVFALTMGGATRPSNANFSTAIQRRFDSHDPKCMFYSNYPKPGHDTAFDFMAMDEVSQALAHAGLFATTVYKVLPPEKANYFSPAQPAKTLYNYALTPMGKRYYSVKGKCFGFKREVVAITNYVKENSSNYKVDFTYKYIVPAWAKQPGIINVASQIPTFLNYKKYLKSGGKPIKKTAYATLTHNGWRAAFMDF